jgi:hypothetical protein
MWLCYLLLSLSLVAGLVMWLATRRVTLLEWGIGFGGGLLVTLVAHAIVISGMTSDTETWSGQVKTATFSPTWVEEYQVAIYRTVTRTRTVGSGKNRHTETYTEEVFSHYETRHRTHPDEWWADDSLSGNFGIGKDFYEAVKREFGGEARAVGGTKGGFDSGDPNVYVAANKTGYIYPTTATRTFENRVKAAPSVYSYAKVPEGSPVFPYPEPRDGHRASDRLKGRAAKDVTILEWDRMNSRLGPVKKVNVVALGFGPGTGTDLGHLQEAAYYGGKKNDLVVCYGGGEEAGQRPTWAYVFGWTEKEICKRELESIVLEKGLTPESMLLIEKEIVKDYEIKDWHKFDYLAVEPSPTSYVVLVVIVLLTQVGYWTWALLNDKDKEGAEKCVNG